MLRIIVSLTLFLGISSIASAYPHSIVSGRGQFSLSSGQTVSLANGYYILQHDGNFVFYSNSGQAMAATGTSHDCPGTSCSMIYQTDGNLVLYSPSGAYWSSGTWGQISSQQFKLADSGLFAEVGETDQYGFAGVWSTGGFESETGYCMFAYSQNGFYYWGYASINLSGTVAQMESQCGSYMNQIYDRHQVSGAGLWITSMGWVEAYFHVE